MLLTDKSRITEGFLIIYLTYYLTPMAILLASLEVARVSMP